VGVNVAFAFFADKLGDVQGGGGKWDRFFKVCCGFWV
jgi:hypothetical protein